MKHKMSLFGPTKHSPVDKVQDISQLVKPVKLTFHLRFLLLILFVIFCSVHRFYAKIRFLLVRRTMESKRPLESFVQQISQAKPEELYLSGRHLRQVPDAVTSLTDIEVLDLSNNELTQLPDGLKNVIKLTLLKALWKDHQIDEKVFDAMVDLLIHLDLCYPINSEGIDEGLRFPWFLQEGEPQDSCMQEFFHKSPSSGRYRFSLKYLYPVMLPSSLFHNFVVRLHQHISDFKSRHDWKNGMYARVKKSCLLVHRSLEAGQSIITVSVEGTEQMQVWWVLLACHHELTALMKQWPGLRWECWIFCPFCMRVNISEPGHFPQSNLEAKCPKGHVTCYHHKKMVPSYLVYPLKQGNYNDQINLNPRMYKAEGGGGGRLPPP